MKTGKRFVRQVALTLAFVLLLGSSAMAGWETDAHGRWYSYADGSYARNEWIRDGNDWYYFGDDGYMESGWLQVGGAWYYLDSNGRMKTGWVQIRNDWYYLKPDGRMATGWQNTDGTWYYLDSSGKMATGWVQDGGAWYYLDSNGKMMTGWVRVKNDWYYLNSDGTMATGWMKLNGAWYYLDSSGRRMSGWVLDGNAWHYLDGSGIMATGWKQIDGSWYYFDSDGRMYSNAYLDQKYFFDESGKWDGIVITGEPEAEPEVPGATDPVNGLKLTFHQDGWYVARLSCQIQDQRTGDLKWIYSDSCAKGQKATLTIAQEYEIARIGYQIWFFGWDNDYMNIPYANTDGSTDFTLSGFGDYPEFTWR